jgi:predicted transcriptional regulator of viral defense system
MSRVPDIPAPVLAAITQALQASARKVFSVTDLLSFLEEQTRILNSDVRPKDILARLLEGGQLTEVSLKSPDYPAITRYAVGDPSPFELAQSIRSGAYLSHASAVSLLGLNDQIPTTLYVNKEQSPKPIPTTPLSQERLDRAFRASPRRSNYIFRHAEDHFVLLSGKNTMDFGVESMTGPQGEPLRVTSLERTLLDIAVRPIYAGGVYQVLEAYKTAASRLSVSRLLEALRKLDYVYPYHQAIGFYLEKAGLPEAQTRPFRDLGLNWDFYLTHGLRDFEHVPSWRLFVPRGF